MRLVRSANPCKCCSSSSSSSSDSPPPNCFECDWAEEVSVYNIDPAVGSASYTWRLVRSSPLPSYASWKPGYPDALYDFNWVLIKETKAANTYEAGTQRESECTKYTLFVCENGKAIDQSELAIEWEDWTMDNPFDPNGNTLPQNGRETYWALDGDTGEFVKEYPESWLPDVWEMIADSAFPPDPVLICP